MKRLDYLQEKLNLSRKNKNNKQKETLSETRENLKGAVNKLLNK